MKTTFKKGNIVLHKETKNEMLISVILPTELASGKQLLYCEYPNKEGLIVYKSFSSEILQLKSANIHSSIY